jgi:UDP-2,3-diacylglucosamine hydrolase
MRLYLSDLHLESANSPVFRTFAELLSQDSRRAESIHILGDLTEVWVGDDDDGELALALKAVLTEAAARCRVFIMHGNRDFLIGSAFARETGVELLEDPHLAEDGTLLSHGDGFCIDDEAYQQVRTLFRSETWQKDILGRTLEARRELARSLRAESQAKNANKAENIMDVASREVDRVAADLGARRMIHGHTHRPGRHLHPWGYRYVLGAWDRCAWIARQTEPGAEPVLECLPFLAD